MHRTAIAALAVALLLSGCDATLEAEAPPAEPPAEEPEPPADGTPVDPEFDREAARADAEALLGLPEDEVEETPMRRIVRRGEEDFPVTMDLRPGRQNLELDDDGTGTYIVTRVLVETPTGDHVVVE